MRGQQERTGPLFSYISTEDRIPASHPLRQVRRLADQALDRLNPTFCKLYPEGGRPSIPPEQLLLALLLQAIYGIRSERMLIEQIDYNLLFRWFVGLNPDDPVWHPTTFTKNRDRLLNEELMAKFLELLLAAPEVKPLLSSEHFSVDGTLLQAWASHASLERIDGEDDPPPRRQALARVLALQSPARSEPKEISEASSSATKPIAPAPIPSLYWPGNPMLTRKCRAAGGTCSWTTCMHLLWITW